MARRPDRTRALTLGAVVTLAAVVRLYRFDLTWFSLDQARDVSVATGIATGVSLPLLGPRIGWTEAYLGPLYFYLLAGPLAIARDPAAGVLFVAASHLLALLLLYRFAREFFGAPVALYAVAFFAVFPLTVFSSRLVWHAGLLPPLVVLYMHALYRLIVGGRSGAVVWLGAVLAVLTQLHLASIALGAVALAALLLFRPRLRIAHVALAAGVFLLLYAPYVAHELRHGFENARALVGVAGPEPGGNHLRSLGRALENLLTLFAPALGGFIVAGEWSPAFLSVLRVAWAAEAILFAVGIAVCVGRLLGIRRRPDADAVMLRRGAALLLLWVSVPILMLGTRQTPIWWYYLDPICPAPFILAGIALTTLPDLSSRKAPAANRLAPALAWLAAAIVACQAIFLIGFQRKTAERGELIVRVPRLSINGVRSPLGTLTTLPLGYRRDIVRSLVREFGVGPDGFPQSVHGAVLGLPEESRYFVRSLSRATERPRGAPGSGELHYLVARSAEPNSGLSASRSRRIGPYAVYEYRPMIDYASWRCGVRPRGESEVEPSRAVTLVQPRGVLTTSPGELLVCRGTVHPPPGGAAATLAVHIVAWAPFEASRLRTAGHDFAPVARLSRQQPLMLSAGSGWSMGLGWASETVFHLTGALGPGDNDVAIEVAGAGRVIRLDVYEGRSW